MRKPQADQEAVEKVPAAHRRDDVELVLLGTCQIGCEESAILAVFVDSMYESAGVEVGIEGAEELEDYLDEVGVDSIALYDEVCGPPELESALVEV